MSRPVAFTLATILLAAYQTAAVAEPRVSAPPLHGIAMHGVVKEPAGFPHFGYVNPGAPKGGRVTLGVNGTFDSLNPLIVKGVAPNGVRDHVIESLLTRGQDEPFSLYGLLATAIEVPDDRSAITFHLHPMATFSDGKPVTTDDVLFSFDLLKEKGRPNFRTYYKKVDKAEKISDRVVRFTFKPEDAQEVAPGAPARFDREMPLIMGLMPVMAKHAFTAETFDRTTLLPFVASGPYTFGKIEAGRTVTYDRNPNYWGRDLPVNRGRFNFAEIRYDYFRDATTMLEAFKTGDIDLRVEEDPARWAEGYKVAAYTDGRIVKRELETTVPAGMTALAFNTRRSHFQDTRVRQALIRLFNFEFLNKSLYFGLFKRTESYFERSVLSAARRPLDLEESRLLKPYAASLKPEVLAGTYRLPETDGSGQNRDNWRQALALLKDAGYEQRGSKLVQSKTGQPLAFEILANTTAHQRMLLNFTSDLERLGIEARVRVVDSAQYQARLTTYDYDMIQVTWTSSLSPGNEQLFRWSERSAGVEGTYNFAGVKTAAADAMISAMLQATTAESFVSAVRALDRVLLSGDYVIPLFHVPKQWVAHWRHLNGPPRTPISGFSLDTWWIEDGK
ncbi:MAG: ABC transporter substrate-binding protein [Hyphomicrobium sp.]|nr:MAG: ABC transporter substrate-binding protein [Hyphomicrobium sp.]